MSDSLVISTAPLLPPPAASPPITIDTTPNPFAVALPPAPPDPPMLWARIPAPPMVLVEANTLFPRLRVTVSPSPPNPPLPPIVTSKPTVTPMASPPDPPPPPMLCARSALELAPVAITEAFGALMVTRPASPPAAPAPPSAPNPAAPPSPPPTLCTRAPWAKFPEVLTAPTLVAFPRVNVALPPSPAYPPPPACPTKESAPPPSPPPPPLAWTRIPCPLNSPVPVSPL